MITSSDGDNFFWTDSQAVRNIIIIKKFVLIINFFFLKLECHLSDIPKCINSNDEIFFGKIKFFVMNVILNFSAHVCVLSFRRAMIIYRWWTTIIRVFGRQANSCSLSRLESQHGYSWNKSNNVLLRSLANHSPCMQ